LNINTENIIQRSKLLFEDIFDYSLTKYINAKTKLKFKCRKHNYIFEQTSNNHFNSKTPCKYCLLENKSLAFSDGFELFKEKIIRKFGTSYDFSLVKYVNQRTPVTLICKIHDINITKKPDLFLRGHGCKLCSNELKNQSNNLTKLIEIKEFVARISGKCITKTYVNNESLLEFECSEGHKFKKSWSAVKNSLRWCPHCSSNKLIGETLARQILEHLLGIKFPSVFLKKMEGLQLDGYNEESKIAFEYQGYQHNNPNSHFHINSNRFDEQIKRDTLKKELCIKNEIKLLEIIEFNTIRAGRIELFVKQIKNVLKSNEIKFNDTPFILDFVSLYRGKKSGLYEEAKKVVNQKNGKLQDYIGSENKHYYHCHKGHLISNRTLSTIIKSNASCPTCNGKETFKNIKGKIESKGGKFFHEGLKEKGLSEEYNWECKNGHKCISSGYSILKGIGCLQCQRLNNKVKIKSDKILEFKKDIVSGKFHQKEILVKYGISYTVIRRLIKELNILPKYLLQNRESQKKKTKGRLFQIDPRNFEIIKIHDSLESVKLDSSNNFTPEGIRVQMKKNKKAYGFYWAREVDLKNLINFLKTNDKKFNKNL
jgi:hypothetical protein